MVRGLFPRHEQDLALPVLLRSVVFLSPRNIESVLVKCTWPRTAWELAHLYLASLGAQLLSGEAPEIVGIVPDKRVDPGEPGAIVRAAAEERNGWRVILAHCTPKQSPRAPEREVRLPEGAASAGADDSSD
jgi:hypothetical protein